MNTIQDEDGAEAGSLILAKIIVKLWSSKQFYEEIHQLIFGRIYVE